MEAQARFALFLSMLSLDVEGSMSSGLLHLVGSLQVEGGAHRRRFTPLLPWGFNARLQ